MIGYFEVAVDPRLEVRDLLLPKREGSDWQEARLAIFALHSPELRYKLLVMQGMRPSAVAILGLSLVANAALLPPSFINSVVAIGHSQPNPSGQPAWITDASGFLYGYLVKDDPEEKNRLYEVYLVTNRHVIENHGTIFVRLNPKHTSDLGRVFEIPNE
jgi:hypothetical protein